MSRYPEYAMSLDSWWWPQAVVLVRVEAESGHSGIGWAEDGVCAASSIIRLHLANFLVGADPFQTDLLWDQMYRASIPYGRKGAAIEAMSAIDLALWDLMGKITGLPVYRLLGGPAKPKVKAYASHLHPVAMDKFVEEAVDYVKQGYTAMKMRMPGHPAQGGKGIQANVDRVKAVRDAVGFDVDVMVDAYMGWDLPFAIRMARALEPFRVGWIEEPLLPDEIGAYAELRTKSGIPIATGEHEFTRYGFEELIRRGCADILQPDVHRAGGLTALRQICAMAGAAGLPVVPHAYSMPAVHLVAATANCPMVEQLTVPVWAKDAAAREPMLSGEPAVVGGEIILPETAGLGVAINPASLPDLAHWAA
jgi:L-alanine-DL-glutamate epimerase-like enolase superfamily enzyme